MYKLVRLHDSKVDAKLDERARRPQAVIRLNFGKGVDWAGGLLLGGVVREDFL
jgi:hypothetical protein